MSLMFFLNDDHFVELKRYHKGFRDKSVNKPITKCSLELTVHINEENDLIDVIPDERTDIGHYDETLETSSDG